MVNDFKDWIVVQSFDHGVSQVGTATSMSAGGGASSRCEHGDFCFTKELDLATPVLALACCKGTHIDNIKMSLCRAAGNKTLVYMEYQLKDVVISSIHNSGQYGSDNLPTEAVSLNYAEINWTYTHQDRSGGGAKGNVATGWSLKQGGEK